VQLAPVAIVQQPFRATRYGDRRVPEVPEVTKVGKTVDEYIASFPPETQVVLQELRGALQAAVPGMDETVRYGMPCVGLGGRYLLHFAGWKRHIGLYPVPVLAPELEREIAPYRATKDTVRMPLAKPIPYELVGRLVAALAATRTESGA
jgi:uncharacterized protein YdhG (YjbR/CyaY superfamily)